MHSNVQPCHTTSRCASSVSPRLSGVSATCTTVTGCASAMLITALCAFTHRTGASLTVEDATVLATGFQFVNDAPGSPNPMQAKPCYAVIGLSLHLTNTEAGRC